MPNLEEISVKTEGKDPVVFKYDTCENLEEAKERYSEPVVFDLFQRSLTIAAQSAARKMVSSDRPLHEIQEFMDRWKPGVIIRGTRTPRITDPVKMLIDNMDNWAPERLAEMMRIIQDRFAAGPNGPQATDVAATSTASTDVEAAPASDVTISPSEPTTIPERPRPRR